MLGSLPSAIYKSPACGGFIYGEVDRWTDTCSTIFLVSAHHESELRKLQLCEAK